MITNDLIGKTVVLRCVQESDAEFILKLRNNPQLNKYIPKLDVTIEQQRQWISRQRETPGDYYFIITDKATKKPLGTISIYGIVGTQAESGRFVCVGDAIQTVESSLLLSNFAVESLSIEKIVIWVMKGNNKALHYNKELGYVFTEGVSSTGVPCMIGTRTLVPQNNRNKKMNRIINYIASLNDDGTTPNS